MVWVKLLENFLSLFPDCELSHFSLSIYKQWVPLVQLLYGKPFYYLLSKIDILYIISDILYRI